jgi:hypothetical protein
MLAVIDLRGVEALVIVGSQHRCGHFVKHGPALQFAAQHEFRRAHRAALVFASIVIEVAAVVGAHAGIDVAASIWKREPIICPYPLPARTYRRGPVVCEQFLKP